MANERLVLCGGANTATLPFGGTPLELRMWGGHPNVDLQISMLADAVTAPVPIGLLDLVDIATYVYCADQAVRRGGDGVENVGAEWRRRLHFVVPVRSPGLWNSEPARAALTGTLGFLSDDDYSFDFVPLKDGPQFPGYLFGEADRGPGAVEEVVLFSGGLDSLAGAIEESVLGSRRVALVTHQPSSKLVPRYEKLRRDLTAKAKHAPLFVPVTINKLKALGREYTQRSRSFLYVALGASVAKAVGLSRVRFYENGVVSLNLPPSSQVVGAKATRTTHPRVLRGFSEIIAIATGANFSVENPFAWRTKTDVVRRIVAAGCAEMINFSTSCTHTWEMTRANPHCGSCSQCIDRRFAVLAGGGEDWEPPEGYKADLLTGARPDNEKRTMLASYVEMAGEVARMSQGEFLARFGEVSRAIRYISGSADEAARRIYEMYRRHGQEVSGVVDRAIAANAKGIRERTLPATCLIRLVCDTTVSGTPRPAVPAPPPVAAPSDSPRAKNSFLRKGTRAWQLWFDGGRDFVLVRSKGAAYLHLLMMSQGTPISAAKLASTVAMRPEEYMLGSAGVASDVDALAAYRERGKELTEELAEARSNNDVARVEAIQKDMFALVERLKADSGLGDRTRRESDDRERVRKSVGNAIRRAVADIGEWSPALAKHLRSPNLKAGLHPCYAPSPAVVWQLI